MTKAERLPDGRVWLQRDNGDALILSAPEAAVVRAATDGHSLSVIPGSAAQAHLARHRGLRPQPPAVTWPADARAPGAALGVAATEEG